MSNKTKYVLELTQKEAQSIIDDVQGKLEEEILWGAPFPAGYLKAREAVVAALNSVGLSGDDL